MTFLQPFILWALPLVLLPVLIHFLNRMRYRTVPWAAMMFLHQANRQSVRQAKLRELLLLLCRMVAVLFLVLFLARPLTGGWMGWAFHGVPDTVLLLLDRSVSMEAREPQDQSSKRMWALKRLTEAARVLDGKTRFVLIDSATGKPTEIGSPALLGELSQSGATDTGANLPRLLQSAADYIMANQCGRTELWLASDLQANDWQVGNAARWAEVSARLGALPQEPRVRLLAAQASAAIENVSVRVSGVKRRHVAGKAELVLTIDLARTETTPVDVPVTVGVEGAKSVVTARMQGQQFRMRHRIDLGERVTRGWGSVELPADANARDNVSYFVFEGEKALRTVVAASDGGAGRVLALAAAPAPDALNQSSRVLSPAAVKASDLQDTALLIWQGSAVEQARAFVEAGGVALIFPQEAGGASAEKDAGFRVTRWRDTDGPLASSEAGESLPVRELFVVKRVGIGGAAATVLATFEDGTPFLTREKWGLGEVYWCATLPKREWSGLAEGSVLVPMVQRILTEGGRRLGGVVSVECGMDVLGAARCLSRTNEVTTGWRSGVYERGAQWVALNRPEGEDQGERVELEEIKKLFGAVPVTVFEESAREERLQSEVWNVFAWGMLLALLLEGCLTLTGAVKGRSDPRVAKI